MCETARHMEFRSSCLVPAAGADAERTPVLVMAGPRTKQRWVYAPNEARTTKGQHEREACVIGQVVDEANARDGWLPSGHAGPTIDLAAPCTRPTYSCPIFCARSTADASSRCSDDATGLPCVCLGPLLCGIRPIRVGYMRRKRRWNVRSVLLVNTTHAGLWDWSDVSVPCCMHALHPSLVRLPRLTPCPPSWSRLPGT